MIELARIVEHQASLSSYRATENEKHALQLELLIEMTKPHDPYFAWHKLISTPFRYTPPHPHARFRPVYGKNVFYASLLEETALYEHAFHFMKERRHLQIKTETGERTLFFVEANDKHAVHIQQEQNCVAIMNKNDYAISQQFVIDHPSKTFLIYPSCRDPQQRDNAAVLDIHHLGKNPKWQATLKFFYDNHHQQISWLDYDLLINWQQVV